ncbi:hypothetical protein [Sedimenticola hydrogenitrophicus]|uniref:hypothetical protein n=1 Tax=Sedimenticola hydrogenitrophicus TaxID=2967975 RepID=UPI0021A95E24|nr:hypothetical protein [Sedimenticola hydrogenitrophicus]
MDKTQRKHLEGAAELLQELLDSSMTLVPCTYAGIKTVAVTQEIDNGILPVLVFVVPDMYEGLIGPAGQEIRNIPASNRSIH